MSNNDLFVNPAPPSNYYRSKKTDDSGQPLTNDDFRKLLMTPSVGSHATMLGSVRGERIKLSTSSSVRSDSLHPLNKKKMTAERKEKKLAYAALVKESKEKEAELAKKYRDRAKERREQQKTAGSNDEFAYEDMATPQQQHSKSVAKQYPPSAAYGGMVAGDNTEIRRRQAIEESKYLGGDLEHTHLVKGLDYALLQKVKAELKSGGQQPKKSKDEHDEEDDDDDEEDEEHDRGKARYGDEDENELKKRLNTNEEEDQNRSEEDEDEQKHIDEKIKSSLKPKILTKTTSAAVAEALNRSKLAETPFAFKKHLETAAATKLATSLTNSSISKLKQLSSEGDDLGEEAGGLKFKTKLGRNIFRVLFEAKELPKTNELFLPHRMAYIVDLTNEYDETGSAVSEIPLTSIRSKVDCPNIEGSTTITTSDIVINKLTQILAYLRHGGKKQERDGKKLKKKPREDGTAADSSTSQLTSGYSSLGIYDDIGDYVPDLSKRTESEASKKKSEEVRRKDYFGQKEKQEEDEAKGPSKEIALEFIKNVSDKYATKKETAKVSTPVPAESTSKKEGKKGASQEGAAATATMNTKNMLGLKFNTSDAYSEYYPGMRADDDFNIDSDEEGDFEEEYSGKKAGAEQVAAGGAAGQKFGAMKKGEGGAVNESKIKFKLDKEWTQISKLIEKRKTGDYESGYKKPKY